MNPGDPKIKIIPPAPQCVPAGSLVFKQGDETREMYLVDEGELVALDIEGSQEKELFRMGKGSLVGVASLFEHEPKRHSVKALTEARLSVVSEACMTSILKAAPVWLLAVIRSITSRTRAARKHTREPMFQDPLQSFAQFLYLRYSGNPLKLRAVLQEFSWQTRATEESGHDAIRSLVRRGMLSLTAGDRESDSKIVVDKPLLLNLLVDFLVCEKSGKMFPPFSLSAREKACLEFLNLEEVFLTRDSRDWLKYLQIASPETSAAEIIRLQELGILHREKVSGHLKLQRSKLEFFLLAIHHEASIRGIRL